MSKNSKSSRQIYNGHLNDEKIYRDNALELARKVGPPVPELYFATVRAIGTPIERTIVRRLRRSLEAAGYLLYEIRLSDCLIEAAGKDLAEINSLAPLDRYRTLTDLGVTYCAGQGRRDAIAIAAVRHLHDTARAEARKKAHKRGLRGVAYLFRSLMHPKEVSRLRKLYGRQLFVISAFSPQQDREKELSRRLAGYDNMRASEFKSTADTFILQENGQESFGTDRQDSGNLADPKYRMNIRRTWQYGDLFVDVSDDKQTAKQIDRLVRLIFSDPFRTPRSGEIGMAQAFSASLESGNLARRVGAAILDEHEDLLAIGTNDVPRPGGGVYRAGSDPDNRDHTVRWGFDNSDINRRTIFTNLIQHLLAEHAWRDALQPDNQHDTGLEAADLTDLSESALNGLVDKLIQSDTVWSSQFFDVIEYGRTLHAEMDALTSASRKHLSTRGSTLYCTTLPCHECARLIVGAGIKRVIFVEPYEKSRAENLYSTEITHHTMASSKRNADDDLVHFIPYVGISPLRLNELFSWLPRKLDDTTLPSGDPRPRKLDGAIVDYDIRKAEVRDSIAGGDAIESVSRFIDLLIHESRTLNEFDDA